MNEYTPTTEEVRETYFITGYKTTPEQFDRWLAEHDRQKLEQGWDECCNAVERNKHRWNAETRTITILFPPNTYRSKQ